jgi:hypothetical protein
MSKTWEHYHHAGSHHEQAACYYKEAAKYDEAEEHEKAAHHEYLAHAHNQLAIHQGAEAAKLHAEQCGELRLNKNKKKSAAFRIGGTLDSRVFSKGKGDKGVDALQNHQ